MNNRALYKIYVKVQTWFGLAVDISSKEYGPAGILSNFTENHFVFDGVECGGMEGFLQSLKHADTEKQLKVCALYGVRAKRKGTWKWIETQTVYWKGECIDRHGEQFQTLVRRAFLAMHEQCPKFRDALSATGKKKLYHTMGKSDPSQTILTEHEFCNILTELRDGSIENNV
ncbi:MAG: hypothetical protein K2L80_08355 [Muribaculaceae bacterium]|nr:hypothetical protein [Muribaculaceae bacterium]MDE6332599.1 hypothetical protein [Muribaculaceae bacterium]